MDGFLGLVCLSCPTLFLGFLLLLNVQVAWKLLSGLLGFASGLTGTEHSVGEEGSPTFVRPSSRVTRVAGVVLMGFGALTAVLFLFAF